MSTKFFAIILVGGGAVLGFLTQLPRADKFSNVGQALNRVGLDLPSLNQAAADNWVGGGVFLALAALVFWWTFAGRRQPQPSSRTAAPVSPDPAPDARQAVIPDANAATAVLSAPAPQSDAPLAQTNMAPKRAARDEPDLPLRELFLWLAPELRADNHDRGRAEAIGQAIIGVLADQSLSAWGKSDAKGRLLRAIPADFWASGELTYWFMPADPRNRELIHAASPDGQQQWRNIHVNAAKAQALLAE